MLWKQRLDVRHALLLCDFLGKVCLNDPLFGRVSSVPFLIIVNRFQVCCSFIFIIIIINCNACIFTTRWKWLCKSISSVLQRLRCLCFLWLRNARRHRVRMAVMVWRLCGGSLSWKRFRRYCRNFFLSFSFSPPLDYIQIVHLRHVSLNKRVHALLLVVNEK